MFGTLGLLMVLFINKPTVQMSTSSSEAGSRIVCPNGDKAFQFLLRLVSLDFVLVSWRLELEQPKIGLRVVPAARRITLDIVMIGLKLFGFFGLSKGGIFFVAPSGWPLC